MLDFIASGDEDAIAECSVFSCQDDTDQVIIKTLATKQCFKSQINLLKILRG